MKILTLNTWNERGPWKERWEMIFQGLRELRPDIAAFQEVFKRDWAEEVQRRTGYEHLVFGEEGSGLMILSRYPVAEAECMTLKAQSPTEEYRRYVLYAKLTVPFPSGHPEHSEGSEILRFAQNDMAVFNTHLSWKLNEGEIREYQVGELLGFIRHKAPKGLAVAMGDFNAPSSAKEICRVMLEGGFIDLFGVKHPGVPGLTWDNRNPFAAGSSVPLPDRRIDYIFMRGVSITKVGSVDIVFAEPRGGIYASDHFGVFAEIQ